MVLVTKRLILRNWTINDADDLYKYAKDPEVALPAGWLPHKDIEESKNIIKTLFLPNPEAYAVCLKDDNKAIGAIPLKDQTTIAIKDYEGELGYWIGKPFWGQELIPEAVQEILRHAFDDLEMDKIYAVYIEGNNKSKRVLEKCYFKYYCTIDEREIKPLNEIRKCHVYYINKEYWENRK